MSFSFPFQRKSLFILFSLKSLFLFSALAFSPLSTAKIHIEPYAGWTWSFTNAKPIKEDTITGTLSAVNYVKEGRHYTGPSAGMRVGYSSLGLAVGVDFTMGQWNSVFKEGLKNFRQKETIEPILPGIFISYKLPLLFRAYATLIPYSPVKFKDNEDGSSKLCNRSRGLKLGVSYLSLPFISVNFEYMPLHIGGANCSTWSHAGTAYVNFIF